MNVRSILGSLLAGFGLFSTLAFAGKEVPETDEARRARIDTLYGEIARGLADVPALTAEQVRTRLDEVVFVDVRDPAERAVSMIPGALTAEELQTRRADLGERDVIVYCTIGARSGSATRALRAQGLRAFNLAGGILAWTHVDGPLVHDGAPTLDVHVWGARFNLVSRSHRGVW